MQKVALLFGETPPPNFGNYVVLVHTLPIMSERFTAIGRGGLAIQRRKVQEEKKQQNILSKISRTYSKVKVAWVFVFFVCTVLRLPADNT